MKAYVRAPRALASRLNELEHSLEALRAYLLEEYNINLKYEIRADCITQTHSFHSFHGHSISHPGSCGEEELVEVSFNGVSVLCPIEEAPKALYLIIRDQLSALEMSGVGVAEGLAVA